MASLEIVLSLPAEVAHGWTDRHLRVSLLYLELQLIGHLLK